MRKLMAAGVAVVAAVVATAIVFADKTETPDEPSPPVLTADDATTAARGVDYTVDHRLRRIDAIRAIAMFSDGDLVVYRGGASTADKVLQIVDPATGRRDFVTTDLVTTDAISLSKSKLWLWRTFRPQGDPSEGRVEAALYDRRTGEHEEFTAPRVLRAKYPAPLRALLPGGDGRLYFMTGAMRCAAMYCSNLRRSEIWSVDPERPDRPRREAGRASDFFLQGSLLTWVEDAGRDAVVHTRDIETGDEGAYRFSGCPVPDTWTDRHGIILASSESLVVASCDANEEVVILDDQAGVLARLRLDSVASSGPAWSQCCPVVSAGNRWVLVDDFAYDTRAERLIRIGHGDPSGQLFTSSNGVDRIVFTLQSPNERGIHWVSATLIAAH